MVRCQIIYLSPKQYNFMNPFKIGTEFKKIVEYMIHAVLIAVADIKNISDNALDLHNQGKVMPDSKHTHR